MNKKYSFAQFYLFTVMFMSFVNAHTSQGMSRLFSRFVPQKIIAATACTASIASLAYSKAQARPTVKERSYSEECVTCKMGKYDNEIREEISSKYAPLPIKAEEKVSQSLTYFGFEQKDDYYETYNPILKKTVRLFIRDCTENNTPVLLSINTTTVDDNHDIRYIVLCVKKEALHTLEQKELLFCIGHELGHIIHVFNRKNPRNTPSEWHLFEKEANLYSVEILGDTEGAISLMEKYQTKRSLQDFYLIAPSMLCSMALSSSIPAVISIIYTWYRNRNNSDFKLYPREKDRIEYIKEYAKHQQWKCTSEGYYKRSEVTT